MNGTFQSNFYPAFLVSGSISLNLTAMEASITYGGWYYYGTTTNFTILNHTDTTASLKSKDSEQTMELNFFQDSACIKGEYKSMIPSDTGNFFIAK